MERNTLDVEIDRRSAKCLLAAAEPDGGCCKQCRLPVPVFVDGLCACCVIKEGLNPFKFGPEPKAAQ